MKKQTKIVLAAAVLLLAAILICVFVFGDSFSRLLGMGGQYTEARENSAGSQVLAAYKGKPVTQSMIDYKKAMGDSRSDGEIMTQILTGMLLLDEAEQLGLAATQAEIRSSLQLLQENYEAYAETAQAVDEFCTGAGITLEQYWADVEEDLYGTISRYNLKTHLAEEYCQSHGYSPEALTDAQQAEVEAAFQAHRANLLHAHQADIVYDPPLSEASP